MDACHHPKVLTLTHLMDGPSIIRDDDLPITSPGGWRSPSPKLGITPSRSFMSFSGPSTRSVPGVHGRAGGAGDTLGTFQLAGPRAPCPVVAAPVSVRLCRPGPQIRFGGSTETVGCINNPDLRPPTAAPWSPSERRLCRDGSPTATRLRTLTMSLRGGSLLWLVARPTPLQQFDRAQIRLCAPRPRRAPRCRCGAGSPAAYEITPSDSSTRRAPVGPRGIGPASIVLIHAAGPARSRDGVGSRTSWVPPTRLEPRPGTMVPPDGGGPRDVRGSSVHLGS